MNNNPKKIIFETNKDLVDFVSRGRIPKEEYFNKFIDAVEYKDYQEDNEINIVDGVLTENNRPIISDVLKRVYDNRIQNKKNIGIGLLSALIIGSIIKYLIKRK